jgi:hypothetical protein
MTFPNMFPVVWCSIRRSIRGKRYIADQEEKCGNDPIRIAAFRDVQAKTAQYSSKQSAQSAALMEECAKDPEV